MAVVGPPRQRVRLMVLSVSSLLADALCLWMLFFAVGIHDGLELGLLSAGAAEAASSIPLLYRAIGTILPAAAAALSIPALRMSARSRQ